MPPDYDDELIGPIATARLELVPFSVRAMRATLQADLAGVAGELDAEVPADLRERLGELFAMRIDQLIADPASRSWLARAMLITDPRTGRHRMVGSVGFHAPPAGTPPSVEIGYHVEPDVRRQGLATEAVRAMLDWAAGQGIHRFRASVAPTNAASLATIARFGFRQVGVQWDEIDGEELVFETDWPRRPDRGGAFTGPVPARSPAIAPCEDAPVTDLDRHAIDPSWSIDTLAVHAGQEPDALTGAVAPPIYQTATYAQDGIGRPRGGYEYARTQNPTRERLERAVAALEAATHGIAFASGSATTAAIAELSGPGDELVVGDDVYGGTFRYLERVHRAKGIDARYVDLAAGPDVLWEALTGRTRLVWFESPSNPLLKVVDIAAIAATVHRRATEGGGRPLIVVDNTFASPALQRPLELGADIVFHSATKYLSGHSDTVLGVAATRDDAVAERLRFLQNAMGAVPGPFDCFLVLRGLRTLALRVERHAANAAAVARFLAGRPDVAWVAYPGMAEGAHAVAGEGLIGPGRQMRTGGGMVSFVPVGGGRHGRPARERAIAICETTRLFTLAESLGGVESLIELPAVMTHASVAGSPLEVPEALVRLSVGIESADDLIADLARALDEA